MNPDLAIMLRRVALAGTALAASVAGHLAATPDTTLVATAPLMWLAMVLVLVPFGAAGARRGGFVAWGPGRTFGALLLLEAGVHLALHHAPWLFGLVVHHEGALVTPAAVAVHLAVAAALTLPMCAGQRLLAGLLAVVRALLPAPRRRAMPRPARRIAMPAPVPAERRFVSSRASRGPPAGRLRPVPATGA